MKKICKHTHWAPVSKDNGASDYCLKQDTRIEGPWEFGLKPNNMSVSDENLAVRKAKNARFINGGLADAVDTGEVLI